MKQKYTFEKVKEEALKYTSKKEFEKVSRAYYAAAHRNGWLETICSHMIVQKKLRWLPQEIEIEAKKYDTKVSFFEGSSGAYKAALNLGIIDQVCQHMHRPDPHNKKWTELKLFEEAAKYKDKREWALKSLGSYSAASKMGIFEKVSFHMFRPPAWNSTWTYELALEELHLHKSRTEFQKNGKGAYSFLQENDLLEKAYEEVNLKRMGGTSLIEQEVFAWVKSIYPDAIDHTKLDNNKQLDIYLPDLKVGIELCGVYWHSEEFLEKKYHYDKMLAAQSQSIRLITIFDNEWMDRQEQVKGFLLSFIKKANTTIYARKCEIKEVDRKVARKFLDDYHIQGAAYSIVYFGLYYGDELIGVLSGGRHHRSGSKTELILDRMCFKTNISVVGGASKLLCHLKEYAQANGYESIKSWSDNRWSEGNVYGKMGF